MPSPRVRIVILLTLAVSCFFIRNVWLLGGFLAAELLIWSVLCLPLQPLVGTLRKLSIFALVIILSYGFIASEALAGDLWMPINIGAWQIQLNQSGLIVGIVMSLRMLLVVIGSMIVQLSGRPEDFVAGLRALGVPTLTALTIDNTLTLFNSQPMRRPGSGGGRGSGRGGGGGGGRTRQMTANDANHELTWKHILKGDFAFLNNMVENALQRSQRMIGNGGNDKHDREVGRDAAVITALCFLMLTTKMLKVLPGVPFAPGYKLVVLIPLYILAGALTRSRWGATFAGTSIGIISFLFGEGRFGVFEILKHITPGLVVDGLLPWMTRRERRPSRWELVIIGALCAAARIATIVAITLLIEAPPLFYALIAPMFLSQTIFGAVSGFVAFYLLRSLDRFRKVLDLPPPSQAEA